MTRPKVLHVCASDKIGGAARAANRLHLAQRNAGIDSHMLVARKTEASPFVHAPQNKYRKLLQRVRLTASGAIARRQISPTNSDLHSMNYFASGLGEWINRSDFDIVNLHWVGAETLSIEEIGRISKPLVWTMHDMWPFSGSEHYDDLEHPGRYINGYNSNNRVPNYSGPDIDASTWRRKEKHWKRQKFQLVSPSRWLAECAEMSVLFGDQSCNVIHNCLDTNIFKPIDRNLARGILGLEADKKYILFGAMSSTSDKRKGFHLLQPALKHLSKFENLTPNTELIVFGASSAENSEDLGLRTHFVGQFTDDVSLALLYSAADIFVAPSMQDNLPNTLVEAMSCGTPCVAFKIGGMTDIIDDGKTGKLVEPFSVTSLSRALYEILQIPLSREKIRDEAINKFSPETVTRAYLELYQNLKK